MSAHGSDFKLSDSFLAGIRTVAAIDKAKGKRMTHTSGPWKAQRKSNDSPLHVTAGHFQIFLGTHTGAPMREWDANARLIAAAPELLFALELIVGAVTRTELFASELETARQAIARATGQ